MEAEPAQDPKPGRLSFSSNVEVDHIEGNAGDERNRLSTTSSFDRGDAPRRRTTRMSVKSSALLKKQGSYIGNVVEGEASRKAMIEYVSLLRWSAECCTSFPLTLLLWLVLVSSVSLQANSDGAFAIRQQLVRHVESIVAVPTKGVAPAQVFNEAADSGSQCVCACATSRQALCQDDVLDDPLFDGLVPRGVGPLAEYQGDIAPAELQLLRARAAQLKLVEEGAAQHPPKGLTDLKDVHDVMFWIQHGLVPDVFHEEGRDMPLDIKKLFEPGTTYGHSDAGLLLKRNQVVGGLRVRQTRFIEGPCTGHAGVTSHYAPEGCYDTNILQAAPFGPGRNSYAEGFLPEGNGYEFNAYMITGRPLYVSLESIEHMLKAFNWVDSGTNTLTVEALFLNAEASPPVFGVLSVHFRVLRSGGIDTEIDVRSTFCDAYPSFFPYMALDFIWCGLVIRLLIRQVGQVCKSCTKKGGDVELLSAFNLVDWATLFLSLCLGIFWFVIMYEMSSAVLAVSEFPKVPTAGSDLDEIKAYNDYWSLAFASVMRVLDFKSAHRLLLFWYALVLTLQFFRVYRGQPKLAQLAYGVLSAFEDLVHFLILFLVMFLNFAFSGFMIYGMHLDSWSTPTKAIMSTSRSLMGDTDLAGMYEVAPISTLAWFCLFYFTTVLVLMNMLLATVYDHFIIAKASAGAYTGVVGQFTAYIKDQWARFRCKDLFQCFCCCFTMCCCKRRNSLKYADEISEELMRAADYTKLERQLVKRSVLGPKFQRKQFDKKMFLGQIGEDRLGANNPCNGDLYSLELEDDYIEHLVENANAYRERESDPKELTVNQMRELVSRAEADISEMRDRLVECQGTLKVSMNSMTNQLVKVEELVHSQLVEVVLCAASAGVPDKTGPANNLLATTGGFGATYTSGMSSTATRMFKNLQQEGTTSTAAMKASPSQTLRKAFSRQPGPVGSLKEVEDWQHSIHRIQSRERAKRLRVGDTN
eukprot:TRINITY_DN54476_c0_g1_i1.p1 TRINITY_DN54476_c0_g1~~TRINITY_DN54476_c0_g1_i1.p1  ORF type:complete len:978 (-),score=182.90 TRINITY_DN54476_c0_g1_i1:41-2974(-)